MACGLHHGMGIGCANCNANARRDIEYKKLSAIEKKKDKERIESLEQRLQRLEARVAELEAKGRKL